MKSSPIRKVINDLKWILNNNKGIKSISTSVLNNNNWIDITVTRNENSILVDIKGI
jgi:hypothetical protein